ncbi:hypothetical protein OC835_007900, partial [Tilletia horrida]
AQGSRSARPTTSSRPLASTTSWSSAPSPSFCPPAPPHALRRHSARSPHSRLKSGYHLGRTTFTRGQVQVGSRRG